MCDESREHTLTGSLTIRGRSIISGAEAKLPPLLHRLERQHHLFNKVGRAPICRKYNAKSSNHQNMSALASAFIAMAFFLQSAKGQQVQNFDAIIVGGGLSGLTAAYTLRKMNPGMRIVVLEARNRTGGRVWSVNMQTANSGANDRFDLGGQWIGANQTSINNLLAELGIATYPQRVNGSRVIQVLPDITPTFYTSNGTDFSDDELSGFSRIQSMLLDDPLNGPYTDIRNIYWNRTTVADGLLLMQIPEAAADAVRSLIHLTFDTTPEQMSMLDFLMFLRSAGNRLDTMLAETGNSAQSYRISGGSQSLVDSLAQNADIRLNQQVCRVQIQGNNVTVGTYQGSVFSASFVIMAIPPFLASGISFNPPLSFAKQTLMMNLKPKTTGIKFVATYPSAFWQDQRLSGNVAFANTTVNAPIMSIVTSDATSAMNAAALEGIVEARSDLDNATRRSAVLNALAQLIGNNIINPIDYREMNWANEPMSVGCMASLGPNQVPSNYADLIRSPTNQRIMWAGTETATEWMGFMDGAVQAGQRAANDVMSSSQVTRNDNVIPTNPYAATTSPSIFFTTQTISYNNGLTGYGQTTGYPFPTPQQNFSQTSGQPGSENGQDILSSVLNALAQLVKSVTDQLESSSNQTTTGQTTIGSLI